MASERGHAEVSKQILADWWPKLRQGRALLHSSFGMAIPILTVKIKYEISGTSRRPIQRMQPHTCFPSVATAHYH